MTGLLHLFVLLVWGAVSVGMAHVFTWRISFPALRLAAAVVAFCGSLMLPVLDEVVGAVQFSELCERSAGFRIGVQQPEGRSTRFAANPSNALVDGKAIPMRHTHVTYTDVSSGEIVVQFDRHVAEAGWLIRTLGISENNSPLLIGRPHCSPELGVAANRTLKFNVVN